VGICLPPRLGPRARARWRSGRARYGRSGSSCTLCTGPPDLPGGPPAISGLSPAARVTLLRGLDLAFTADEFRRLAPLSQSQIVRLWEGRDRSRKRRRAAGPSAGSSADSPAPRKTPPPSSAVLVKNTDEVMKA
jgi:hypothetical protein